MGICVWPYAWSRHNLIIWAWQIYGSLEISLIGKVFFLGGTAQWQLEQAEWNNLCELVCALRALSVCECVCVLCQCVLCVFAICLSFSEEPCVLCYAFSSHSTSLPYSRIACARCRLCSLYLSLLHRSPGSLFCCQSRLVLPNFDYSGISCVLWVPRLTRLLPATCRMPRLTANLRCGLHTFRLKYFLKSFTTHTRVHIRTHSPCRWLPHSAGTCTIFCVGSSLSSWSSLTLLSLCALTQFVLTFAQLTHPLECRQAAQRVANPDHVCSGSAGDVVRRIWRIRGLELNTLRNYLTTWPIPVTPSLVSFPVPFGDKIRQKSFLIDSLAGRKFPLAISSARQGELSFKVISNK